MLDHSDEIQNADGDSQNDDIAIVDAVKKSVLVLACAALLVLVAFGVYWLNRPAKIERRTEVVLPEVRRTNVAEAPSIPLVDIAKSSGIEWVHFNGMDGEKLLPETMGGGVAVLDYDRDSDQDLLFVGGMSWPWSNSQSKEPRSLALFANNGKAQFHDVSAATGIDQTLFAMGAATGDYDNDGWVDLFVTAVGQNHLYHNRRGVFVDVTPTAGVAGKSDQWSTSAAWLDFDRDGFLDLFVCNYIVWSRELDLSLGSSLTGIGRAYGQPTNFSGTHCYLYRNLKNGQFEDVSHRAGIQVSNPNTQVAVGKALGVVVADVDRDGWTDIIVANDTVQNFLFINQRNGTFIESAVPTGIAFDRLGNATGAMGIDCAWVRNDDSMAVAIGNFANEPASFYLSRMSQANFFDAAMACGIGPVTKLSLTFGMFFCDLDLDGRQDLVCTNGHLESEITKVQPNQQYAQSPILFWNAGPDQTSEFIRLGSEQLGPAALMPIVGRGAAYGDLDNDGDLDLVFVANGGQPVILRNDQQIGNHWLRVVLEGNTAVRDAASAIVRVTCGNVTQTRCISSARSYLSACEMPQTFGIGKATRVERIEVLWPDGKTQTLGPIDVDQVLVIKQS